MENKKLKNAEISRQNLENVKGGNTRALQVCPSCGGTIWQTIPGIEGHTTLQCLHCGLIIAFPDL